MKFNKVLSAFAVLAFALQFQVAQADVCVPTDPDYDPVLCSAGGSGSGAPGGGPTSAVPVDGGASLLAAAGLAYVGRRFAARKKAAQIQEQA